MEFSGKILRPLKRSIPIKGIILHPLDVQPDGVKRAIDFDSLHEAEQSRLITEAYAVAEDGIAAEREYQEAEWHDAREYQRELARERDADRFE